jgi:chromosome segregation ATPase
MMDYHDIRTPYERQLDEKDAEIERLRTKCDALKQALDAAQTALNSDRGGHAEIARLREALEWYANKKNYFFNQDIGEVPTFRDNGDKARAALATAADVPPEGKDE